MNITNIAKYINQNIKQNLNYGVITGSGQYIMSKPIVTIPYTLIPGFINSTVRGHSGEFNIYKINSSFILCASGRFHYYENKSYDDVTSIIDIFHCLGINNIIISNSSGCINKNWNLNKMMIIDSYFDTTLKIENTIIKKNIKVNKKYKRLAKECYTGTYAQVIGPTYETISEIRMLESLNVDAVGMSTVPEIRKCINLQKDFIVICSLTNYAAGIVDSVLSHTEVLEEAGKLNKELNRLIKLII